MNNSLKENQKPIYLSDAVADDTVDLISEPESILAHSRMQTYAGTLRPGIKVPYESGKDALSPKEKALYKKRVLGGRSPREIEKEIGKMLRPKNVPYFSVYRTECKNRPEHADLIRSLYGNERGEISRLRITFLSDKWWEYLPHNLMAFKRSGLYCSSERIGGKLVASRDPELENGTGGKNESHRRFKREKITLPCIPDECPIYQSKGCQFSGVLHFLILGIPGTDLWRLPTTSLYSVAAIYKKLNDFNQAFRKKGKSIIGMPFELYKAEEEISRWDPEKGRVRNKQWIIRIDCPELPLADLIVQMSSFNLEQNGSVKPLLENRSQEQPPLQENRSIPPTTTNRDVNGKGRGNRGIREEPAAPEKAEIKAHEEEEAADPLTAIRSSILSELEPIGVVPMSVVEVFLAEVKKSRFDELSLEEVQTLSQKVFAAKKNASRLNNPEKSHSNLPPRTQAERKPVGQVKDAIF